ncbi:hypothetical protein J6590_065099 [Homalodisca vitripennis]|nr:hypothetical protein J6590_065099 [Homalodisca vitripennis]
MTGSEAPFIEPPLARSTYRLSVKVIDKPSVNGLTFVLPPLARGSPLIFLTALCYVYIQRTTDCDNRWTTQARIAHNANLGHGLGAQAEGCADHRQKNIKDFETKKKWRRKRNVNGLFSVCRSRERV